jgi:hypothetical protein
LTLQTLEPREVPVTSMTRDALGAVTVTQADGTGTVFTLTGNGTAFSFQLSNDTYTGAAPTDVVFSAGNTIATLTPVVLPVSSITLNLGDRDDTLAVGSLDGLILGVADLNVTLNGQDGNDTLRVNDASDSTNNEYTVTGSTVIRRNGVGGLGTVVNYATTEAVSLAAGMGGDLLFVDSTTVNTTVNAGDGPDAVSVGGVPPEDGCPVAPGCPSGVDPRPSLPAASRPSASRFKRSFSSLPGLK